MASEKWPTTWLVNKSFFETQRKGGAERASENVLSLSAPLHLCVSKKETDNSLPPKGSKETAKPRQANTKTNMTKLKLLTILSAMLAFFGQATTHAAAENPSTKMLTRAIRVIDDEGQPVPDAMVDGGLINDQYFWPQGVERKPTKTDSKGMATLHYPEIADYSVVEVLVESVKISVYHSKFCSEQAVVPVGQGLDSPFEVKLTPGISLTLNAVDAMGKPVTEPFAVVMTGSYFISRWNRPTPAQAISSGFKSGNQQLMLFQPKPDGRHLFSDVLSFHFDRDKQPAVVVDEVELQPGMQIKGRLDGRVPRPVTNGFVLAAHAPLPLGNTYSDEVPSLIYYSVADIKADGTFGFPSMPTTGTVQLIGLCDQWVGLSEEKSPFIVGQSFDVEEDRLPFVLDMQRTFDAKIRVVDQAGQPVAGIGLLCTPNQLYKKGGSTILGMRRDSAAILACQIRDEYDPAIFAFDIKRFQGISDSQGKMVIRNLPNSRWSKSFECWSPKTSKVKIKGNESVEGKLPDENEFEVQFDVKVEVIEDKATLKP